MKLVAVLNRDGGTLRTMDLDAFCAGAEAVFAAHGHALDCRVVPGEAVAETLDAVAGESGVDVLLAAGGDGTVSTAARAAFATGMPLAVLPAGTMNLFARALGVPLDLDAALEALAGGELARVDIATANGVPFVHQYGVGVHARLVRIRDSLAYGSRMGKMLASLRAVAAAIVDPPRFEVEIATAEGVERRRTSGIAISNNPLGDGHFPHADELDAGVLGIYVTEPMTTAELARLAVEVLVGAWRANPMVSERRLAEVTLRFPRRKRSSRAVLDGELIPLDAEVQIRLHPAALNVLRPRAETPADAA